MVVGELRAAAGRRQVQGTVVMVCRVWWRWERAVVRRRRRAGVVVTRPVERGRRW